MGLMCKIFGHKYEDKVVYDILGRDKSIGLVASKCSRCKDWDISLAILGDNPGLDEEVVVACQPEVGAVAVPTKKTKKATKKAVAIAA